MLVQQILGSKASGGVLSVKPTDSVSDAIKLLSEKRIGSVVVSANGESLDGILSERDVVRELGRRGATVLAEPVSALMTAKIVTCSETDTADQILQMMTDGRFRHLPVMREGVGEAGAYLTSDNPAKAAQTIEALLGEPAQLRRLSEKGLKRSERFRWDDAARIVADTCHRLLGKIPC